MTEHLSIYFLVSKNKGVIFLLFFLILASCLFGNDRQQGEQKQIMANYYCEYCGMQFSSVRALTACRCARHPSGSNKGYHKVYEGSEKTQYTCKFCGLKFSSIRAMTACRCARHLNGANKGYHAPTL